MKLGMIGLGAMGLPICRRLLANNYEVKAFDLVEKATLEARESGAEICESAALAATDVDIVLCSLPNAAIVSGVLREVLASETLSLKYFIDLSSISPDSARNHAKMTAERGIEYMDCPVSGGVGGAAQGTLTVMAGGSDKGFAAVLPVLEAIGKKIYHVGSTGTGSGIKMVNNYLLGCNMAAVAEALVLGAKIGLDLDTMYEIIGSSSGRSFIIENKIPNFIKKRNFEGGFAVDLEHKDLGLAADTAKQLRMPTPMGSTAIQIFETARAKGYGRQDITALLKIWEELMDIEVK